MKKNDLPNQDVRAEPPRTRDSRAGHNDSNRRGGRKKDAHAKGGGGGRADLQPTTTEEADADLIYALQLSLEESKREQAGERTAQNKQRGGNRGNFLLNFQYTAGGNNRTNFRERKKAPQFNKEAFLLANCHFLLTPEEYAASLLDPDHHVDWVAVEHVYWPTEELPSCPICLEVPVAARITKCGHIFCSACILHYLCTGEKSWSRCPLCFEAIYRKTLKSVTFQIQERCEIGQQRDFVLLHRAKGELVPLLQGQEANPTFARVSMATDINDIFVKEYRELQRALKAEEKDSPESVFLRQAIEELLGRQQQWEQQYTKQQQQQPQQQQQTPATPSESRGTGWDDAETPPLKPLAKPRAFAQLQRLPDTAKAPVDTPKAPEAAAKRSSQGPDSAPLTPAAAGGGPSPTKKEGKFTLNPTAAAFCLPPSALADSERGDSESEEGATTAVRVHTGATTPTTTPTTATTTATTTAATTTTATTEDGERTYRFYQSKDGACVFLHAFNYRCLKREFGQEENFPQNLSGKILALDKYVQNFDTRQRLRFLSYLPMQTTFYLALLDLSATLSPATNKAFAGELQELQRRRAQDLKRAQQLERRRLARLGVLPTELQEGATEGVLDHTFLNGFDLEEGQFPELPLDAPPPAPAAAATLGWSNVAEKGFGASVLYPALESSKPNNRKSPILSPSLAPTSSAKSTPSTAASSTSATATSAPSAAPSALLPSQPAAKPLPAWGPPPAETATAKAAGKKKTVWAPMKLG